MLPILFTILVISQPATPDATRAAKWEKEIVAIEKRLAEKPPVKGGMFFAGSSTMRLWDVKKAFPELNANNVGFGGSDIRDSTTFAARILLPFEPKTILFYAGDNDIANNRTPEQVRDDFAAFTAVIHAKLPKAQILFLAIKPSVKRWNLYDVQKKANAFVKQNCEKNPLLKYIDTIPATLGTDGTPDPELLQKDGLHLSEKGYTKWNDLVRTALKDS